MRLGMASLVLVLPLVLCSCDSWPPFQKKATDHFAESRDSLEALEAKFSSSKYVSVSSAAGDNTIGVIEIEGGRDREIIDNDLEFASLLTKAQVWRVIRQDKAVVFVVTGPHSQDGRETEISLIHFSDIESDLKECRPEFEGLKCGVCGVRLKPEWWIKYMWYPYPILETEHEKFLNGQLAEEAYFEMQDSAYQECRIDGLSAIGYEIE